MTGSDDKSARTNSGSDVNMDSSSSMSYKASWSFQSVFSMSGSASATSSSSKKSAPKKSDKSLPKSASNKALPQWAPPEHPIPEPESESETEHRDDAPSSKTSEKRDGPTGPTKDEPFNFSSGDTLDIVECSDSEEEDDMPLIAIPQRKSTATSPFLTGYPPSLRTHGISKETWASFLDTVSGFLEASVSQSAIDHAMNIASEVGKRPKKLVANVASRASSIGQEIGNSAKRGNIVGVTAGILKGTLSLPLNLVLGTTNAVLGLPITAALAASKKPPTARQRATAYLAVANEKWLVGRGRFAGIVDTKGLAELLGLTTSSLPVVEEKDENGVTSEETQYNVLEEYVEELDTWGDSETQIGQETLWLVLTHVVEE